MPLDDYVYDETAGVGTTIYVFDTGASPNSLVGDMSRIYLHCKIAYG